MGAVHAELMGATCVGNEPDKGLSGGRDLKHFIFGDGRFPALRIDHLPRTVVPVGCQR
jgi:hypothetical protein